MSLRRLLASVLSAILCHPHRVVVGSLVAAAIAIVLGSGVELRTSRNELAPPDDPDQQRWDRLLDTYSGAEALIACVEVAPGEPADPAALRAFADRIAARFASDPLIAHVFHRIEPSWLTDRALYLIPPDRLRELVESVDAERDYVAEIVGAAGLVELNGLLATRIETALRESSGVRTPGADAEQFLVQFLEAQLRLLEEPERTVDGWLAEDPWQALAGSRAQRIVDGYLATRDGSTLFVLISPLDRDDSLAARRGLLAAMRDLARLAVEESPGFRVAFTGTPAVVVEEMDTIRTDTWRTSIAALLGVAALTFLVFRWRSHALLVLLALLAGLVWAFGAVRLELGYLNLITSSFISTLVGVGVAYGIHPVSEYELRGAHTSDPVQAVGDAFQRTGAAVAVAGLTTAAAFFSILLMQFRGFAELGLVAGVGVLLCLVAALVTLPAMLVLQGQRRRRRSPGEADRTAAAVDYLWVDRIASRICRFPRTVVGGSVVVTGVAGWLASGLAFDTNILDLLPRDAESLRYQRKMVTESELSPLFNVVVAEDLDDLAAMHERALREPAIDRFDSTLELLAADPEASAVQLARLRDLIEEFRPAPAPLPTDRAELRRSLERLETALEDATDAAFNAGLADLVGSLDTARVAAEKAARVVGGAAEGSESRWDRAQRRLFDTGVEMRGTLARMAVANPPTVETLPIQLRDRFFTTDGQPLGFLFPAGEVFDPDERADFVEASRRVSPEVTGFPVVFSKMSRRILEGFRAAVIAGALLVVIILFIVFGNLKDALLALLPLTMGVIWMMAAMRLLGLSFNFANLVAIPLIIGVGIDNGVHVIQRVRLEGQAGMATVLSHTGRAIVIASLTTMIGFGSLALASHRGMWSLGVALLLGVAACLITSTLVLPNTLVVLGRVRR